MKTRAEIQWAHDLIVGALLGEIGPLNLGVEIEHGLTGAAKALCWILEDGHEHTADHFRQMLEVLVHKAMERGYEFPLWPKEGPEAPSIAPMSTPQAPNQNAL